MCHVVLLGGLMILAPHIVLCALRTVTYARGTGKVVFFRTDRLLELSKMGTYVTYPYLELHGYRALIT